MIERRRIWADAELADYIREELGYPGARQGARQGAMVEKQKVDITTGEVSRELWADHELRSVWAPRVAQAVPRPLEH